MNVELKEIVAKISLDKNLNLNFEREKKTGDNINNYQDVSYILAIYYYFSLIYQFDMSDEVFNCLKCKGYYLDFDKYKYLNMSKDTIGVDVMVYEKYEDDKVNILEILNKKEYDTEC